MPSKKLSLSQIIIFLLLLLKRRTTLLIHHQMYKNRLVLLLAPFCLLFACHPSDTKPFPATEPPQKQLQYLALGNSYTIGTAIPALQRYPSLLADTLMQAHGYDTVQLRIIARNGWTTTDLLQGLDTSQVDSNYHLVSLLIGVNNQYQGLPLPLYRREMRILLKRAIAYAQGRPSRVLVISIPDWSATPAGRGIRDSVAQAIDRHNAINQHLADSLGLSYAAITELSRAAIGQPALVAADSLHFSARMHRRWRPLLFQRSDSLLRLHW